MLKKLEKSRDRGFTLIEIVIVLAIAALIILVVLQAVASAQRAQRDTARKDEAGRMVSLLEQYASNNGGVYPLTPAAADAMLVSYDANASAVSNLGNKYTIAAACASPVTSTTFSTAYAVLAGNRDYTLSACLENGGAAQIHPAP